jgi:hypothetical protein
MHILIPEFIFARTKDRIHDISQSTTRSHNAYHHSHRNMSQSTTRSHSASLTRVQQVYYMKHDKFTKRDVRYKTGQQRTCSTGTTRSPPPRESSLRNEEEHPFSMANCSSSKFLHCDCSKLTCWFHVRVCLELTWIG